MALTVPTASLPLAANRVSTRLDSTLMSSIFSRTLCRYFVFAAPLLLRLRLRLRLLLLLFAYNAATRIYAILQPTTTIFVVIIFDFDNLQLQQH